MDIGMTLKEFIQLHSDDDIRSLALQRNRYTDLSDVDFRFALQQIEGRQRMRDKLPSLVADGNWLFPPSLSLEQCSSELTARYKSSLVGGERFADLTGGFGIDSFYLAKHFRHSIYVERQENLCALARHNFASFPISVVCSTAEEYLQESTEHYTVLFLDPARRSSSGSKVFRMADCEPNVEALYPTLITRCDRLLLKLSPMLDLTQALRSLPDAKEAHIVAVKGEVKEMLVMCQQSNDASDVSIHTINFTPQGEERFSFHIGEEATPVYLSAPSQANYLYLPNGAIMKAGAFALLAQRMGMQLIGANSHILTSADWIANFPGRCFQIEETICKSTLTKVLDRIHHRAQVITRNYPLTADALRRKLHIGEDDSMAIIGTRIGTTPILFLARKIK